MGRQPPRLGADALERMRRYRWPGNVRELQNMMERAAVLCPGGVVDAAQLPVELSAETAPAAAPATEAETWEDLEMQPRVEALERRLIGQALEQAGDNKAGAARLLRISERSLWYKIKKYGL